MPELWVDSLHQQSKKMCANADLIKFSGASAFSRGYPKSTRDTGPIGKVEFDSVIERVASGWKRAQGDGGRLIAAESISDLPVAILRAAEAQNVPQNEIKGVFHKGHIYLVEITTRS